MPAPSPITPAGPMSLPLSRLKTLLSASTSFQTWVGKTSAADALAFIFLVATRTTTRPLAVIGQGEKWELAKIAEVAFQTSGSLLILFEDNTNSTYLDPAYNADAELDFMNKVGNCCKDMAVLAGTSGYLSALSFSLMDGPRRTDENERKTEGDLYQAVIRVEYGI